MAPKFRTRGNWDRQFLSEWTARAAQYAYVHTLKIYIEILINIPFIFFSFFLRPDFLTTARNSMTISVTVRTRGANKYTTQHVHPACVTTHIRTRLACACAWRTHSYLSLSGVRVCVCVCICVCVCVCVCACVKCTRGHGSEKRKNNTAEQRVHSRDCTDRGDRSWSSHRCHLTAMSVPFLSSAATSLSVPLRRHGSPHLFPPSPHIDAIGMCWQRRLFMYACLRICKSRYWSVILREYWYFLISSGQGDWGNDITEI